MAFLIVLFIILFISTIVTVSKYNKMVKYRNNATMDAISKVYRKHIDKYMNKIGNIKLN